MYRVSPLTYVVGGIAATGLHGRPVACSPRELSVFNPPAGVTCGAYLERFLADAAGQLLNPRATTQCQYCIWTYADQPLSISGVSWSARWRNFGIGWAYVAFNLAMAVTLYWAFRVRDWKRMNPKIRLVGYYTRVALIGKTEGVDDLKQMDSTVHQQLY